MTLVIKKPTTSKLVMRKGWQPMDSDAATYIAAVEAADGQALEEKTKIAIDNFVLGCKADGIWTAIKASCILAGARTLSGALVPLVGAAPTNLNFVSGDYNRKTGLVGNASNKFLDSNRNNNTDPQNSRHLSVFTTSAPSGNAFLISTLTNGASGQSYIFQSGTLLSTFLSGVSSSLAYTAPSVPTGFIGSSRPSSSLITVRALAVSTSSSISSVAPVNETIQVFGNSTFPSNARLAFYSIGEALDLARLDSRVTDLINAFAASIP